jgi:hypothetical protein
MIKTLDRMVNINVNALFHDWIEASAESPTDDINPPIPDNNPAPIKAGISGVNILDIFDRKFRTLPVPRTFALTSFATSEADLKCSSSKFSFISAPRSRSTIFENSTATLLTNPGPIVFIFSG